MSRAFSELFGVPELDGLSMAGRTDAWIVDQAAGRHGFHIDASTLERFREIYLRHLASEIEKPGPRTGIMPGVRRLLDDLAGRADAVMAAPGRQAWMFGGSERGPVALPVFKIGCSPIVAGGLGSTPRRFRHAEHAQGSGVPKLSTVRRWALPPHQRSAQGSMS